MVPKDKGWGMSNLGYGKNPCFVTLLICHLFVSPNLVNLFNAQLVVEELWLGELLLKWWWLWQAVSLTQLPTPPMAAHSSPSCTLPWSVHSLTTILGLLLPHAQVLDEFGLT